MLHFTKLKIVTNMHLNKIAYEVGSINLRGKLCRDAEEIGGMNIIEKIT